MIRLAARKRSFTIGERVFVDGGGYLRVLIRGGRYASAGHVLRAQPEAFTAKSRRMELSENGERALRGELRLEDARMA